jgi:ABC-2 type transport system permease protein
MLSLLPVLIILWFIFQPQWQPVWWSILLFFPAVILAYILRYMALYAVAHLAFWTTRLEALLNAWFLTEYIVSGRFAPLGLLPPWLRIIADFLPFQWMFGFPLEMILGNLTPSEVLVGFGIQAFWLVVALLAYRLLWRRGVKRYSAVGG